MNECFYHGIEYYPGAVSFVLQRMETILNEGLITRNKAREYNDEKYEHVCLYRRNPDFDYSSQDMIINSARFGWIDRQFVFVINPDIDAKKAITGVETNLVDEWRSNSDILPSDIIGIALPFETIKEYLNSPIFIEQDEGMSKEAIMEKMSNLLKKATEMGIAVFDSDKPDFFDKCEEMKNKRTKSV